MDSKVYIIHGSAIVHSGLTDILRRHFKCSVLSFFSLSDFEDSELSTSENSIIFTEDCLTDNGSYLHFISRCNNVKSYTIINAKKPDSAKANPRTIYLFDPPDEIYEQVKEAFNIRELTDDEGEGLSNREIDVLKLVALGFSNKEIADKLFISTHTVMSHRKNMTEKLGIKSISGLTVYAIINNYIDTTNINVKDLI